MYLPPIIIAHYCEQDSNLGYYIQRYIWKAQNTWNMFLEFSGGHYRQVRWPPLRVVPLVVSDAMDKLALFPVLL